MFNSDDKKIAINNLEIEGKKYEKIIEKITEEAEKLYNYRFKALKITITNVDKVIKKSKNLDETFIKSFENLVATLVQFEDTTKLVEESYKQAQLQENDSNILVGAGKGIVAGVGATTLGTSAIGVLATFGTAGTGTAIGTLSGAALTSATTAWGGTTLALMGPIGWVIGGATVAGTLYSSYSNNEEAINQARQEQRKIVNMGYFAEYTLGNIINVRNEVNEIFQNIQKKMKSVEMMTDRKGSATFIQENMDNLSELIFTKVEHEFSLEEIIATLKVSILMIITSEYSSDDKGDLIDNTLTDFFSLKNFMSENKTDSLLHQVMFFNEETSEYGIYSLLQEEIQIEFIASLSKIKDEVILSMLVDLLLTLANNEDEEMTIDSFRLYNMFVGYLHSDLENYYEPLIKLTKSQQSDLYSSSGHDIEKYENKVRSALDSYAKGIDIDDVVSLYDDTVFGKADEGFIVTPTAIITDMAGDERVIVLGNIFNIINVENTISFFDIENEMIATLSYTYTEITDFIVFLEEITEINNLNQKEEIEEKIEEVDSDNLELTHQEKIVNLSDIKEWHLAHKGTQFGLHSLKNIDMKFNQKQLEEDGLLAWKDGMSEWKLAIDIIEINEIIEKYRVTTPPPLPSSPPPLPV